MSKFALIAILVASILAVHVAPLISADGGARDAIVYGLRINPIVNGTNISIYGPGRDLLVEIGGLTANYHITDHLASSRLVLGDSNIARHECGPYGAIAAGEDDARYAGHRYDANPGVYVTPNRTYDPSSGRFLSTDPGRQGASPYPYAGNNPVGNVDPKGSIYVPFFISSGFNRQSPADRSPIIETVKMALGGTHNQPVYPDTDFFNFQRDGHIPGGDVFEAVGRQHINIGYDDGTETLFHRRAIFWLVGNEEGALNAPIDAGEVFSRWEAMGYRAFESLIIIDTSGEAYRGQPIYEALFDAGVPHAIINTQVVAETPFLSTFIAEGEVMNLAEFSEYVGRAVGVMVDNRRHRGWPFYRDWRDRVNATPWLRQQERWGNLEGGDYASRGLGSPSSQISDTVRPLDLRGPSSIPSQRGGATVEPGGRDIPNPGIINLEPFEGDVP